MGNWRHESNLMAELVKGRLTRSIATVFPTVVEEMDAAFTDEITSKLGEDGTLFAWSTCPLFGRNAHRASCEWYRLDTHLTDWSTHEGHHPHEQQALRWTAPMYVSPVTSSLCVCGCDVLTNITTQVGTRSTSTST